MRRVRVWALAVTVQVLALVGNLVCRMRDVRSGRDSNEVLLVGAYGNGNYGDDAIGIAIADSLRRIEHQVRIVGRRPDGNRLRHATGGAFFLAPDGFRGLAATFRASRGISAAILGGGGLLEGKRNDVNVHRLVLEYVGKLLVARLRRVPVYVHGVGVSNDLYSDRLVTRTVLRALRSVDGISVRDQDSLRVLRAHDIDAVLVEDPAVALLEGWAAKVTKRQGVVGFVGLDRFRWPQFDRKGPEAEAARQVEVNSLAERIAEVAEHAETVELHPFHFSDPPLLEEVGTSLAAMDPPPPSIVLKPYPSDSVERAFSELMQCETVVSMRFHPSLAVLAAHRAVHVVGNLQKLLALRSRENCEDGRVYPAEFGDPHAVLTEWLTGDASSRA